MVHSIKLFLILFTILAFFNACKPKPTQQEQQPMSFSDYASAETWIKQTHKVETITPESSLIKQIDYYSSKNNGYLIITLHKGKTPTLLYQNITPKFWEDFKNSESKGKFYNKHIQGNEDFVFKLDSQKQ